MSRRGIYLSLAVFLVILASLFYVSFPVNAANDGKISEEVLSISSSAEKVPVVIVMKSGKSPNSILSASSLSVQSSGGEDLLSLSEDEIENVYAVNSIGAVYGEVSADAIEKLNQNPDVLKVEYRPLLQISLTESTSLINATRVWPKNVSNINLTGVDETICVIDTGTNYTHSALGGCTTADFLAGNCAKTIGGYDFCANDAGPCSGEDSDPMDANGHGTHVSGIAAANGSVTGVAPGAKIVSLKVCNSTGSCPFGAVSSAIDWCVSNRTVFNISAITISLGTGTLYTNYCDGDFSTEATAINSAVSKNITVTIATGNDGSTTGIASPACIRNATAVGAVSKADVFFYNRNNLTDVIAPGVAIVSTCIDGTTCSKQGTSMSTPHAAGAVALLQQANRLQANRDLLQTEVEAALKNFSDQRNDSSGTGLNFSRLNVFKAADSLTAPSFTFISKPNQSLVGQTVTINLTASDPLLGIVNATIYINSTVYEMTRSGDYYFFNFQIPNAQNTTYNVTFSDSVQSNTSETTLLEIGDDVFPQFSNVSAQVLNYSLLSHFNVSWTDNFAISAVWVDFDGVNYTGGNISSTNSIYKFNISAVAGTHNLTWYANDTSNNVNSTGRLTINITKANPQINLTILAGSILYSSNFNYENSSELNITATSAGEGNLNIILNGTLINVGATLISNRTNLSAGTYNVTAFYAETQNYTTDNEVIFVTAETQESPPVAYRVAPANGNYSKTNNVTFTINATDATLKNATLHVYNRTGDLIATNFTNITGTFNQTSWVNTLAEGNYSWSALVYDNRSNANWTVGANFTLVVDITLPSATISVSDTSITTAERTNITCTGSDTNFQSITLVVDGDTENSSTTLTTITFEYDPSSSGTKVANCTVKDRAGNIRSDTDDISVSSTSSGSSGSGGGGGSSSTTSGGGGSVSSDTTTVVFTSVSAGGIARVNTNSGTEEATGITELSVTLKQTAVNFRITVKEATSVANPITEEIIKVFKYISIDHPDLSDDAIEKANINFEVQKSWLSDSGASEDTVKLFRYSNNQWNELSTSKVSEDSVKVSYTAASPGLSIFAITAEGGTEVSAEAANETSTGLADEEKKDPFAFIKNISVSKNGLIAFSVIVFVILVVFILRTVIGSKIKKEYRWGRRVSKTSLAPKVKKESKKEPVQKTSQTFSQKSAAEPAKQGNDIFQSNDMATFRKTKI